MSEAAVAAGARQLLSAVAAKEWLSAQGIPVVPTQVVPLRLKDARAMIREVRGLPILQGFRGTRAAGLGALEDMLSTLSSLAEQHPEIHELDLNPLIAYPTGLLAVDARIVLTPSSAVHDEPPTTAFMAR